MACLEAHRSCSELSLKCADHAQGWPQHGEPTEVQTGQQLVLNADPNADISDSSKLAVAYSGFADMCQPGDQLFIGRYLVNGADQSSLYLEASSGHCMFLTLLL